MDSEVEICLKDCQTLLSGSPQCSGWLRKKAMVHKWGEAISKNFTSLSDVTSKIINKVQWDKHFIIVYEDLIFIFKDETSKKAEKIIRLLEFESVEELTQDSKEPWPFRLIKREGDQEDFSAASRDDRKKWLGALSEMLAKVKRRRCNNNNYNNNNNNNDDDDDKSKNNKKKTNPLVKGGKILSKMISNVESDESDESDESCGNYEKPDGDSNERDIVKGFQKNCAQVNKGLNHMVSPKKSYRGPLPAIPPIGGDGDGDSVHSVYDSIKEEGSGDEENKVGQLNRAVKARSSNSNKVPAKVIQGKVPILPVTTNPSKKTQLPFPPNALAVPLGNKPSFAVTKKPIPTPPTSLNTNGTGQRSPPQTAPYVKKKPPPAPPQGLGSQKPTGRVLPNKTTSTQPTYEIYEESKDDLIYEDGDKSGMLEKNAMWPGNPNDATEMIGKLTSHEGTFLIRKATEGTGYTIHVVCGGCSKKFKIGYQTNQNKGYSMGDKRFSSLVELILYFKENDLPNNIHSKLVKPYQEIINGR